MRKSIDKSYRKCHRKLFGLTDNINRKFLGKLGYYLLIDFMRSPEMFKNITLSSLIFIQDNNIGREEIKYKEYEVESKALYTIRKGNKKSTVIIKK